MTPAEALKAQCLVGAFYHDDMERFFGTVDRCGKFITLLAGSAVIARHAELAGALVFLAAVTAGLSLAFGIADRANRHGILKTESWDLHAALCDSKPDIAAIERRVRASHAKEPPVKHAAVALAYNKAHEALGWRGRMKLTRWQRATRHWLAHSGVEFPEG